MQPPPLVGTTSTKGGSRSAGLDTLAGHPHLLLVAAAAGAAGAAAAGVAAAGGGGSSWLRTAAVSGA